MWNSDEIWSEKIEYEKRHKWDWLKNIINFIGKLIYYLFK
jgi:hypothetical protein